MTTSSRSRARRLHRSWAGGLAIVLAATGPVLAACGTDIASGSPNAATPAVGDGPAVTTVTTVAGKTVRVPDAKPTALFFFTVGCGECAGGAKSLSQAARAAGDNAEFLAVDMDPNESARDITGFLSSVDGAALPAAIDTGAALTQRFEVSALSTLIVLDPSGTVTYRATDPSAQAITTALGQSGAR